MLEAGRRAPSLALALALASGGCNLVFGVGGGEPKETTGSASGGAGTSSSGGVGGTGGTGSVGGMGGLGGTGGASCDFYDGDASITATDVGGANIATITFAASQSVSAVYSSGDTTEWSIGGGASGPLCKVGVKVSLSGLAEEGIEYTPVSEETTALPGFHDAPYAFVQLFAADQCDPRITKMWASQDLSPGTLKIESIVGTVMVMSFTGVEITGVTDAMYSGEGKLVLDGSAHADCFIP